MENKKDNIIKRWWKLTEPNKVHFAGQIIYYIIYTVFLSVITIFAAKTINCMYDENWNGAFLYLALELSTIVLRNIALHFQYKCYTKQISHIRYVVSKKIYAKVLSCKKEDFNAVSREKITNIALNNMTYLSEFPDAIASFIGYMFQVIFVLVTVFVSNWLAGVIVSILGVVNFFAYYFFNRKLGKLMLRRYEKKDDMFKSYSKVIDGKNVIKELHSNEKYEGELIRDVQGFTRAYSEYYNVYSWKNNLYFAMWNVVVYAIAALMLYFVSNRSLDISIYLIIVPYLSTCTDKLNTLFDKTSNLENMRVDVDRVNLILNLNDEEIIKYGELNKESEGYNLGLVNVSFNKKRGYNYAIKNADISFKTNAINVIKGERNGGKRAVFDMLRRYVKPDDGKILLDNLNLYDYNEKTFKNHIDYCASHPSFVSGTVKENLMLTSKDFDHIKSIAEKTGFLDDIINLPNGFDTEIEDIKSSQIYFIIGLLRALLFSSKILMIYEIPEDCGPEFRKRIIDFLSTCNIDKTIIIFTHSDDYDDLAEMVYSIREGKVKLVKPKKINRDN